MSISQLYVPTLPSTPSNVSDELVKSIAANHARGLLARYHKYDTMYIQAMNLIDMIQRYRSIDRTAILIGSIKDAGDPQSTAINLALNAKTIADKKISTRTIKEWSSKARKQLLG